MWIVCTQIKKHCQAPYLDTTPCSSHALLSVLDSEANVITVIAILRVWIINEGGSGDTSASIHTLIEEMPITLTVSHRFPVMRPRALGEAPTRLAASPLWMYLIVGGEGDKRDHSGEPRVNIDYSVMCSHLVCDSLAIPHIVHTWSVTPWQSYGPPSRWLQKWCRGHRRQYGTAFLLIKGGDRRMRAVAMVRDRHTFLSPHMLPPTPCPPPRELATSPFLVRPWPRSGSTVAVHP